MKTLNYSEISKVITNIEKIIQVDNLERRLLTEKNDYFEALQEGDLEFAEISKKDFEITAKKLIEKTAELTANEIEFLRKSYFCYDDVDGFSVTIL